jgi:hypothetical protein
MAGGVDDAVDRSNWAGLGGRLAQGGRKADGYQDRDHEPRPMPEGSNGGPVVHRGRLVKQRNGPAAKRHRGSVMDASLWSSLAIIVPVAVKLTIIVDNPNDPGAFEAHYNSPAYKGSLGKIPDMQRAESAKVFPKEDGSPTPAYRTIDIYFSDYATACAALASPEAGDLAGGLAQAATGGIRFLLSDIED